jgi:hypothetical protein
MAAALDGTNGLSFNDGTQMGTANSLGMRNILFDADFRINQRGYVSAATLAAGAYGHDRFKAGASGGDYSFTQLNSSTQITIASGKSLIQVVEDKNVVGGSYVLSWTGTALARVGVNSATPSGTFVVSPILITGQTAGTTMSVEFNAGTLNTAQLELGTVATPFERRPIGLELALCQRYYEQSLGLSNLTGTRACAAITTTSLIGFVFVTQKRAAPTVVLFSRSGAANTVSRIITGADVAGSSTAAAIGPQGFLRIDCSAANYVVGEGYEANYSATAEL